MCNTICPGYLLVNSSVRYQPFLFPSIMKWLQYFTEAHRHHSQNHFLAARFILFYSREFYLDRREFQFTVANFILTDAWFIYSHEFYLTATCFISQSAVLFYCYEIYFHRHLYFTVASLFYCRKFYLTTASFILLPQVLLYQRKFISRPRVLFPPRKFNYCR